ncbi:MAG TPA: thiamine phosphate synthase [Nitrospiraceae bacterium]|nr:thiamine phosphate synthase [Nitrospiraceae bacterium]
MPAVDFRLLLVTDRQQTGGRPLLDVLTSALAAGVRAIQLRERDLSSRDLLRLARDVQRLTIASGAQLLINDRVDVAMTLDNVGVHLRANSLPVTVARKLLGGQRVIGLSAHSVDEVVRGEAEGADYVVLGPVYETPSKAMYGAPLGVRALEEACRRIRVPVIGIGGVTATRARDVRRAGVFGVAVVTAVLAADDVERAVRELLDAVSMSSS